MREREKQRNTEIGEKMLQFEGEMRERDREKDEGEIKKTGREKEKKKERRSKKDRQRGT